MTPTKAQQHLEDLFAPWVKALSPQVTAIGPEGCTMVIPVTPEIMRAGDIVSGQTLAALADTAMVFACFGHYGTPTPVGTVTLDTQFLRPAVGETIRAEAEITRAGKSMLFARATLIAEPSEKPVAMATATFAK